MLRRWLLAMLAGGSLAIGVAFAASWAVWWFWYDVPPPQVVVPRCPADADLYVAVVGYKTTNTEFHCFRYGDATDVQEQQAEARKELLQSELHDPLPAPDPNYGDQP